VPRTQHRLARARHSLAQAGIRVVRPRTSGRPPSPIEALLPWAPVLVGIGILIGFIVSVFVLPVGNPSKPGFPDLAGPPIVPPEPTEPADEEQADQGPRYLVPEAYEVQYSPTPSPSPPPPPPPAFDPGLIGKYKVEQLYGDVFIAAVVIVNESDQAAGWTVELAYGRDVGRLNTFWVDGTAQPGLETVDERYVFTSAEDVPAGSAVALKVHLDKSGFDIAPKTCLVNGEDCVIVNGYDGYDGYDGDLGR
jgi:hypothetical protein